MADKKENKKAKKKHYSDQYVNDLHRQIEELKGQLELKAEILEKTDQKNDTLFNKSKQLQEEKNILEKEKEEVIARMQRADENQNVGGLLAEINGERIAREWNSLYEHEWTTAYEELCTRDKGEKSHKGPEKQLMSITEWCYSTCSDLANNQLEKIKPLLSEVSSYLNLHDMEQEILQETNNTEEVSNTLDSLIDHIQYRRHHDRQLIIRLKEKYIKDYKLAHEEALQSELKFVGKCCELCWLMCTCNPPMTLEYKNLEGVNLDKSSFNQYNMVGSKIELVVWPVLRLHENGPVIMKGIARTYSESEENDYDYPPSPLPVYEKMSESPNETHIFKNINHHRDVPNPLTQSLPIEKTNDDEHLYMTMEFRPRVNPFDTTRRPTTHYIREPKPKPFQNLSKSDKEGLKSSDDILNSPKARPKLHGRKPENPKDGTFVSYLTTNSSTM